MKSENEPHILIVEDDPDSLDALSLLLTMEGYRNIGAKNGAEALDYLRSHPEPSVILLDLYMPVMSGEEFRVKQLENPRLARIPTFCMSASPRQQITMRGLAGTISKPVDFDVLLDTIAPHYGGDGARL